MMWAKAPIYMRKGVAAPAPETNQKWLERTREGGPCVLRHKDNLTIIGVINLK
jgi:hypothetical protein